MKRFRYVFDPLCLACCALYALNRWGIKPHTHLALFRFWFNDLLLIPCALPPLLQVYRWLQLRTHDRRPTAAEVFGHLIFWSALFEWAGPHLVRGTTGDWRDVLAYAVGGLAGFACWRIRRRDELCESPFLSRILSGKIGTRGTRPSKS
ncbi:MAG TPA: hypothetical protein VGF13_17530 [Verrucomicrobiae bacterium]